MGCAVIRHHNGHHTHKVIIDETVLDRVCEALGILPAERLRLISGTESIHIYRGSWPMPAYPPTPGTPPTPPGGRGS
jgi:hypothetical protein